VIRYAIELLRSLWNRELGQDVVEYAMLTGAIGIVIAVALLAPGSPFPTAVSNFVTSMGNCVNVTTTPYTCP